MGRVVVVRGVRGAEQDGMKPNDIVEVFDRRSGGMRLRMKGEYRSSYYVEGWKFWDPETRRKCCIVSTSESNKKSRIRGNGKGRRLVVGVLVGAEFGQFLRGW